MSNTNSGERLGAVAPTGPLREVPVDWEALEDAFENNAPEVHSYLHLTTGEVLRGSSTALLTPRCMSESLPDGGNLRIDPVRTMGAIPMDGAVHPHWRSEYTSLRNLLAQAIDGKRRVPAGSRRRLDEPFAEERERFSSSSGASAYERSWRHG